MIHFNTARETSMIVNQGQAHQSMRLNDSGLLRCHALISMIASVSAKSCREARSMIDVNTRDSAGETRVDNRDRRRSYQ